MTSHNFDYLVSGECVPIKEDEQVFDKKRISVELSSLIKTLHHGASVSIFKKVIHDINNAMTIISGSFQLTRRMIKKEEIPIEKINKLSEDGLNAVEKVQDINENFLSFLIDGPSSSESISLREVISDFEPLLGKNLKRTGLFPQLMGDQAKDLNLDPSVYTFLFLILCWLNETTVADENNYFKIDLSSSNIIGFQFCLNEAFDKFNKIINGPTSKEPASPFINLAFEHLKLRGFNLKLEGGGDNCSVCIEFSKKDQNAA